MAEKQNEPSADTLSPKKGTSGFTDVISALHRHDGKMATQEQKVADYVKAHLQDISAMTIAQLAGHCGVSTPTVIRFCRTLGCDGFREFKLRLAQNLAVSQQYLSAAPGLSAPTGNGAIDQILCTIFAKAIEMRDQVDTGALDLAKQALLDSRHLLCAGIGGGSSVIAQEAANRFFRLGVPSFAVNDSCILQMRAATLTGGDVLLLISASGEADAIVSAAEIAGGYGATTICITKPDTRLAKACTIPILVDVHEDIDIHKPTASRYIHLILVDALAMSVAQALPNKATENLHRIQTSLTAYHGRTGPQPLGD
ncbi:MurR/RpiR family transcriptional regulator [Marinovum sp. 2_MG-2023]|uniref:MurR/RpiR family transcriptional regulator n=1 Tax=unclassified Marinovum TaxID=2647166 RepID=UPI0026E2FC3F|nr:MULTISPECIES: MurR/RpiR family transcriptional regulator [unclassified Marinovum]MDO6729649.1 MurR/RpiR family transcriptional regulator [Marinovum sp. 2_MG-2023]MDO6779463.1 MurR/RpiR family transcriptional regulator [Marinovum sp. 1_MG-2023]